MEIIYDKQEKKPLVFNHPLITGMSKEHLDYMGDYACRFKDGYMPPLRFERKEDDLFSSLTRGYRKLKNEFNRARENDIVLVLIITGTLTKIAKGRWEKRKDKKTGKIIKVFLEGEPRVKQLFTMMMRYRIPMVFCKDRAEMVEFITRTYITLGQQYVENKKKERA